MRDIEKHHLQPGGVLPKTCNLLPLHRMDVYLASPWIPPEWIAAHGHQPRGIWSDPELTASSAALPAGLCAFGEAVIQFARARPDAALVVPTTCDQLRRGGDDLGVGCQSRVFLFNFPATWQTTTARDLYRNELERLSGFLTCLGGKRPSQERLRSVMLDRSSARRLLLDLAAWCHGRAYARMVARYHWDGTAAFPGSGGESAVERVRLALVGGPMTVAQWSIFDIIDEAGGRVALDGTEGGERSLPPPIEPEVFEGELPCALAHFYFDHCVDVFQRPNTRLHGWLAERIGTRQIRGVLLWQHTNCDLWRAETESLRETLKLPLIALNADETQTIPQRLAVRVEAFVESLR